MRPLVVMLDVEEDYCASHEGKPCRFLHNGECRVFVAPEMVEASPGGMRRTKNCQQVEKLAENMGLLVAGISHLADPFRR